MPAGAQMEPLYVWHAIASNSIGPFCVALCLEVAVKQGVRIFVRPRTFFNQLQWSTHHMLILVAFFAIAAVETNVGNFHHFYEGFAAALKSRFGINYNVALWIITFAKLGLMILGTYAVSSLVWLFGNLLGRKNSRRVLTRRLAVVFTVLLAAHAVQYFAPGNQVFGIACLALYGWGVVLGYFALRTHFEFNHLETMVVALFAILVVTGSWHFSHRVIEVALRNQVETGSNGMATTHAPSVSNPR